MPKSTDEKSVTLHPTFEAKLRDVVFDALGSAAPHVFSAGGSGGGDSTGLEPRIAKLEATTEHIQSDVKDIKTDVREIRGDHDRDFRILFGALIISTLGLAGVMAKGFGWI